MCARTSLFQAGHVGIVHCMYPTELSPQALDKAMIEAVNYVSPGGWDAPPTLFALVPTRLLAEVEDDAPLTLVVQDGLPADLAPGSEELGQYIASIEWPQAVVGAILAQEITMIDPNDEAQAGRTARLFSGVLRTGAERTMFHLRPTATTDKLDLLGAPNVGTGVITALRASFD